MLLYDLREIGNNMYIVRKKMGLTQEEVAERASLSSRTYADMERGNVNIRMETLLKICQVLCITPDEILTKDERSQIYDESEILSRLGQCSYRQRQTAYKLLSVYLDSLE